MTWGLSVADLMFLFEERRHALTSIPMSLWKPCCRPSNIYRTKSASGCLARHACHAGKFSGVWTMEILRSEHEDGVILALRERRSSVYLYLPLESIKSIWDHCRDFRGAARSESRYVDEGRPWQP
jgi:hypothetical protein